MKESIDKIIFTLNLIDVHGVDNMSRMLGCIQELEKIRASIDESEKEDKPSSK